MWRALVSNLLFAGLLMLPACGYHLEGHPENVSGTPQRLYIELFGNDSSRAFVNDELTSRLVERFSRSSRFVIVESPQAADVTLAGSLLDYDASPLAYNHSDGIAAQRLALKVQAILRRTGDGGGILWKGILTEEKDYAVSTDRAVQQAAERVAVSSVCERLASDLYARLVDEVVWPALKVP